MTDDSQLSPVERFPEYYDASGLDLAERLPDGRLRYIVNRIGAVQDLGNRAGYVLAPPPQLRGIVTSQDGRERQAQRYEQARETTRETIANHSKTSTKNVFGGLAVIADAQMDLATNPDKGRASTEAAKWLVRMADLVPDPRQAISAGDKLDAAALDGMRLLFAWLDQQHGPGWRDQLREALRGGADVGDGDSEK